MQVPYPPRLGEIVYYYIDGDTEADPQVAIVVGPRAIGQDGKLNLAIIRDQSLQLACQRSVPHVSDPYLKSHPQFAHTRGGWDFTQDTKSLRAIERRMAILREEMDVILAKVDGPRKPQKQGQ